MVANRIVIVGAGQAGGWAARTLRDEGFEGEVVLIGQELHAPYERPPLSKEFLLGDVEVSQLSVVDEKELDGLNITMRFNTVVKSINAEKKKIFFSDGSDSLDYDYLVMCTGGRPRKLSIPNIGKDDLLTLRTIEDSLKIRDSVINNPGQTLIIGGGWIGLELASAAASLGAKVTVLEAFSRLCARTVPADISEDLLNLHRNNGVDVKLDASTDNINKLADGAFEVALKSGETLQVNNIVLAIGLISNDDLANEAGIDCANGIVVDEFCKSSNEYVYAAGDVANVKTFNGTRLRLESWQNAQDQGIAVARSILYGEKYNPIPRVWSQQFDKFIQIVGYFDDPINVVRNTKNGGKINFFLDEDGVVRGAIGQNAGREWRFASRLVERSIKATAQSLADTEIALKSLI